MIGNAFSKVPFHCYVSVPEGNSLITLLYWSKLPESGIEGDVCRAGNVLVIRQVPFLFLKVSASQLSCQFFQDEPIYLTWKEMPIESTIFTQNPTITTHNNQYYIKPTSLSSLGNSPIHILIYITNYPQKITILTALTNRPFSKNPSTGVWFAGDQLDHTLPGLDMLDMLVDIKYDMTNVAV